MEKDKKFGELEFSSYEKVPDEYKEKIRDAVQILSKASRHLVVIGDTDGIMYSFHKTDISKDSYLKENKNKDVAEMSGLAALILSFMNVIANKYDVSVSDLLKGMVDTQGFVDMLGKIGKIKQVEDAVKSIVNEDERADKIKKLLNTDEDVTKITFHKKKF